MVDLFEYNWDVREDWFTWCESLGDEEFHKERIGGMKSFRETLIHIIDCELLWLNTILGDRIIYEGRESIYHLDEIRQYSAYVQLKTKAFIVNVKPDDEYRTIEVKRRDGSFRHFSQKKIVAHIITHEIHHIGQLSVWAREIGLKPVSSDLIIRNIYEWRKTLDALRVYLVVKKIGHVKTWGRTLECATCSSPFQETIQLAIAKYEGMETDGRFSHDELASFIQYI